MKALTLQNINEICGEIKGFLNQQKIENKEIIRISFALEEALLNYRKVFGEEQKFSCSCSKKMGVTRIVIKVANRSYNPFECAENESADLIIRNLLSEMSVGPVWKYIQGYNSILVSIPRKKQSPTFWLCTAIVMGIVLGLLCGQLPDSVTTSLSNNITTPIFDTLMGIITAVAGPVIFLSVVWGICNIGDTDTLGSIGKKLMGRFFLYTIFFGALIMLCYLPAFEIEMKSSEVSNSGIAGIIGMILDMIPENFFAPFVDSNPMQIIVIAFVVGFVILILGEKVTLVVEGIEQLNLIIQYIMSGVNAILPVFIFVSLFNMMIAKEYGTLVGSYRTLLLVILGAIIIAIVYCIIIKIKLKVSIKEYIKVSFPSVLIGLSTGSSSAAFATSLDICINKLGVPKKIVNFALPLGQVIYMPGVMVVYLSATFVMADNYEVPMTITWLVMAFMVCAILSIATPPIAGGPLTGFTIVFTQLGIPTEAIAVALVISLFLEMIGAGINIFSVQSELLLLSHSLGELDEEKLVSEM